MKGASIALFALAGLVEITAAAAFQQAATQPPAPKPAGAPPQAKSQPAAKAPAAAQKTAPSGAAKSLTAPKPAANKTVARRTVRPLPPVDPTIGDVVDGEDMTVRRAAVAALGPTQGAVVAVDPSTGRVLSIVNQKLALKSGFTPCSTIKLVTALAALNEGIIQRNTNLRVSPRVTLNLTNALAQSNNPYFQRLGEQLGYERVTRYAQMLGLGEKAGLDIPGEEAGVWPAEAPKLSGVGLVTAYGQDILMTPLELAALLSTIANGGTLYYLQYPGTPEAAAAMEPKIKRTVEIGGYSDVKAGMRAAVDTGTGRRAGYDPNEPVLGKTGTCTDFREYNHMGWFGSFNDVDFHRLVIVVMLTSPRTTSGAAASGVAGAIYRNLSEQRYFASDLQHNAGPGELVSTAVCCSR